MATTHVSAGLQMIALQEIRTDRKKEAGMGLIYLLHFERSYHHARHYLGYTEQREQDRQRVL